MVDYAGRVPDDHPTRPEAADVKRGNRMSKPARRCIFCGAKGVTKEHFFPRWCAPLFVDTITDKRIELSFTQAGPRQLVGTPSFLTRPGSVLTKKIRVVCGNCNNTWMSAIEAAAQPVITALATGINITLNTDHKAKLAQWAALKVMVCEHSIIDDSITPPSQREEFRVNRDVIPQGFQIWVGRCGLDRWRGGLYRSAATYCLPGHVPNDTSRKNTQTVTIGLGDLFLFVLTRTTEPLFDLDLKPSQLSRLWPLDQQELNWRNVERLTLKQADDVARTLAGC